MTYQVKIVKQKEINIFGKARETLVVSLLERPAFIL